MQKKYEVIRFVKQGQDCHVVSDCVTGEILAEYLKRNPNIAKEQLFLWVHQLIRELINVSNVKNILNYGYLNPFCIVIKQDNMLSLLNLKAENNREILCATERYHIPQFFFKKGQYDEIFAFGKTLQFILAKTNISPPLSMMEEMKLKHIISKCLSDNFKKKYQNFSKIKSDFPKKVKKRKKKRICVVGVIIVFLLICMGKWQIKEEKSNTYDESTNEMNDICMELGQLYFLTLEDYKKSHEMFSRVEENVMADYYAQLSAFMAGNDVLSEEEVLQILGMLEAEEVGSYVHQGCLFRVYRKLNSEEAKQQIVWLGNELLKEGSEKELWLSDEMEYEIYEALLNVYLESRTYEKVIEYCGEVSLETKFSVIRVVCRDNLLTKEEKENYLAGLLKENKGITKEEGFVKLQTEYGIQVEGEKVWLEN